MENSMEGPQEIKVELAYEENNPTSRVVEKEKIEIRISKIYQQAYIQ